MRSKIIDKEFLKYVQKILKNLYIEISSDNKGFLCELMQDDNLEGWCFQTTESAIVFFNDDAYIERGNIKLDEEFSWSFHSWICFRFNGVEYVFDPCLNILCRKSDYVEVYETEVKGRVCAKVMKEELIRQMLTSKKEIEEEIRVSYLEDTNAAFFRNGSGYKGVIDKEIIKSLTVHFYKPVHY